MKIAKQTLKKMEAVCSRNQAYLRRKRNVVGIAIGEKIVGRKPTGKPALVVFVQKKMAASSLRAADLVDEVIDGVITDVVGGWSDLKPIPGWFGKKTAGADIAITDINGDGRPDLVVFHIHSRPGQNHGYYRIGWNLDANGNVPGWSDIKEVPGWFGKKTAGAGLAITDINGNGRPDLVVFHIHSRPGQNHGYYRIGWDLDKKGNTTNWTDPILIPRWFGKNTAGAGLAITDINGNGRPDLVVFHIHKGWKKIGGGSGWWDPLVRDTKIRWYRGWYRIGWDLDTGGNVSKWSERKKIPGIHPDFLSLGFQGAGIAISNINRKGRPDLVVFHLNDRPHGNFGYYQIGWDLDSEGNVTGGWSDRYRVPGWFGANDQGAGLAVTDLDGNNRPELFVSHIHNPPGENHGYYRLAFNLNSHGVTF